MTTIELLPGVHTRHGGANGQAGEFPAVPKLEPGAFDANGLFLFVKNPAADELEQIHAMAAREIPGVADLDVVKSVYGHNPVSFWAFMRSADETRTGAELVGFCAFLPLTVEGVAALGAGKLNTGNPDSVHLAARDSVPAALYLWAIVAHGTADLGGKLIGHAFGLDFYEHLPMYGTVGTESGRRALQKRQNSPQASTATIGSFFEIRYPKAFLEEMRALDVRARRRSPARAERPKLETRLAATPDQIAKVFAIRAAVFLAEQGCPYDEEFDGNDYAGAHVLGLVNGEPAAVLRVRYFAEFVKLERLAVLPRFRRTLIAKHVVEHAIAISLWERFGFETMNKNTQLVFSDHEYVEMLGEIAPHDAPLTPFSDPYVLIRPEGHWDVPGVLDRSSERRATNPQKDRLVGASAA
jgi:predicted GNAT family N-acyltransferase